MAFLLAGTMAVCVVQLEVTSSAVATGIPNDASVSEPLHDVNRANKSGRLAFERGDGRNVTYVLYDTRTQDNATATRIRLDQPRPVIRSGGPVALAWELSSEVRDTCEPLISPMLADELKIDPKRCPA
jgi:hypothetical protein